MRPYPDQFLVFQRPDNPAQVSRVQIQPGPQLPQGDPGTYLVQHPGRPERAGLAKVLVGKHSRLLGEVAAEPAKGCHVLIRVTHRSLTLVKEFAYLKGGHREAQLSVAARAAGALASSRMIRISVLARSVEMPSSFFSESREIGVRVCPGRRAVAVVVECRW